MLFRSGVRLGVFGALFLFVLFWIGRGDPRLAGITTPQPGAKRLVKEKAD